MINKSCISLRTLDIEKDLQRFHDAYSDPLSMKFYGMKAFTNEDQSLNLMRNYIDSEEKQISVHRVICEQDTNDYMGEIGIFNINRLHHRANAYCILLPEYRKKGISIIASALFYREVFGLMQINRIQALVDSRNHGAINSLKGIGFAYEGMLSQYEFFDNEYIDMVVFALLKERFYELYS